jgi:hypothetical protein
MNEGQLIIWLRKNDFMLTADAVELKNWEWLEIQIKGYMGENKEYKNKLRNYLRQRKLKMLADEH